jgi:dolichyl-phosphate beta-glucosyltransferase
LDEISRLSSVLDGNERIEMVFGARVQLLGRHIERRTWRHYLGRVFATVASLSLDLPIYDTQCGAKLFRVMPATRALFAEPFLAGWFFDVEIVARRIALARSQDLLPTAEVLYELPLMKWVDVAGSKLGPTDFGRALFEILRVHRRYLARSAPPFGAG